MSTSDIIEMAETKQSGATNNYIIAAVAFVAIIILLVFIIRFRKRGILKNQKLILASVFFVFLFAVVISEGIQANIVASRLNKDYAEMVTESASGEIADVYAAARTLYIVIDSQPYICDEVGLNFDVMSGQNVRIEYLVNSKLIIDIDEVG